MVEPGEGDVSRKLKLAKMEISGAGVCMNLKRIVRRAQEPSNLAGELHNVVHHMRKSNERGKPFHLPETGTHDRPIARRVVAIVAEQLKIALERVSAANAVKAAAL